MAAAIGDNGCWIEVSSCAAIDAQSERLACFDERATNACHTAPLVTPPSSKVGGSSPSSTPLPPAVVPTQTTPASDFGLIEPPKKKLEPQSLEANVATVKRSAAGLVITLDVDNQVWRQVDSNRLSLKKGERVRIKAGLGGSFYLNKTKGSRSIRVRRIR